MHRNSGHFRSNDFVRTEVIFKSSRFTPSQIASAAILWKREESLKLSWHSIFRRTATFIFRRVISKILWKLLAEILRSLLWWHNEMFCVDRRKQSPLRASALLTSITLMDWKWNNLTSNFAWKFLDYQFPIFYHDLLCMYVVCLSISHEKFYSQTFSFLFSAVCPSQSILLYVRVNSSQSERNNNKLLIFHVLHKIFFPRFLYNNHFVFIYSMLPDLCDLISGQMNLKWNICGCLRWFSKTLEYFNWCFGWNLWDFGPKLIEKLFFAANEFTENFSILHCQTLPWGNTTGKICILMCFFANFSLHKSAVV